MGQRSPGAIHGCQASIANRGGVCIWASRRPGTEPEGTHHKAPCLRVHGKPPSLRVHGLPPTPSPARCRRARCHGFPERRYASVWKPSLNAGTSTTPSNPSTRMMQARMRGTARLSTDAGPEEHKVHVGGERPQALRCGSVRRGGGQVGVLDEKSRVSI